MRRSLSIVASLAVSACSGATTTELFDPVSQDGSPTAPIAGTNDDDATSPGSTGSAASANGGGSTEPGASSGGDTGGGDDGATDDDPPPPPANACVSEKEPNDGPELTEWFTECFEGAVKRGDVDYASISAPDTAKRIAIHHEETGGEVRYRLYINGLQYGSFSGEAPTLIPVFPGGTYTFEMSPLGTSSPTRKYELHVTFE